MNEPICYVDRNIQLSEESAARLKNAGFSVEPIRPGQAGAKLVEVQYLLLHSFLADECLKTMRNCRYIGIRAHNTDYVNGRIAGEMGIILRGLRNQYGINAVAEHTMALIFGLAKNLLESHQNLAGGRWREGLSPNAELAGKKLGIVGYGKIGRRVGEIGKAFSMELLIAAKQEPRNGQELPLEEVLRQADILVVLIPGTEANRHFFNRERLELLKDGAFFINTARGSVVDYQALASLVEDGKLGGVGLDVYPEEPADEFQLARHPKVICTPHIAYYTREALNNMDHELVENFLEYIVEKNQGSIRP